MRTVIIGAGSYATAIIAYLREFGPLTPSLALDDDRSKWDTEVCGTPVTGPIDSMDALATSDIEAALICLGDNRLRIRWNQRARELGLATPGFVHPRASVSNYASVSGGCIVLDGAVIQPYSQIAESCLVSANVTVAHHTQLHPGVSLAAGSVIGAGITIEECVAVGVGANVMTGVTTIGADAVIGAGATVIRDVEPGQTVVGVPAKPLRR